MPSKTRECLLDAAEALFLENGFAATSLRSVASKADVNLAATHYHFGSKQGLFEAMVHRRVTPINDARLELLDSLEAEQRPLEVREIITVFLQPLRDGQNQKNLHGLIGRIFSEPPVVVNALVEKEFGEVASRFTLALSRLLPELSLSELQWRFHFLVGGMLQSIRLPAPLGSTQETNAACMFEQLINFASAGFLAPAQLSTDSSVRGEVV